MLKASITVPTRQTKSLVLLVANRLIELNGGYAAAVDGRIAAEAALPLWGIVQIGPMMKASRRCDGSTERSTRNSAPTSRVSTPAPASRAWQ